MILCPETNPVIMGHEPAASSAINDTCDSVHLKNADGVLIMVNQISNSSGTSLVLTVHEGATDAICKAGTNPLSASSSQSFMIWSNLDTATNDTMVRRSDAVTYTIVSGSGTLDQTCIYVPSGILTDGMEYINVGTTGGNGANLAGITYMLDKPRYKQVTPPTAGA
jgi:hypothetical protein